MKLSNRIYILIRCITGIIFIYAGVSKLFDTEVFAALINAYGIFPDALVMLSALGLPVLEIMAGTGLIFDIRGSLIIITALLIMFIAVLGYGIFLGLDIDCGCFGPDDPETEAYHGLRTTLYRDIFILIVTLYLYSWRRIKNLKPLSLHFYLKKYFKRRI